MKILPFLCQCRQEMDITRGFLVLRVSPIVYRENVRVNHSNIVTNFTISTALSPHDGSHSKK